MEMREWLDIRALPGSYSSILVEQLARHLVDKTASIFAVLDEIGKMQGTWKGKPLGEPQQFKHKPLAGLWKQHFFQAAFMVRNLINEAHSDESMEAFKEIADAFNSGGNPAKGIHDLIIGGISRRASNGTLTGEWIIYAKDENGENRFLTLAKHAECERQPGETKQAWQQESDAIIYERICACRADFPNLEL